MNPLYEAALQRLEQYRVSNCLSQADMGKLMGVTQSHYSKLKQGKKVISGASLVSLSKQNIDIDYFITGEETYETELNWYVNEYSEYTSELLPMLAWAVNRGISMMDKSGEWSRVDYQKEIDLFHLKEWSSQAQERVWYGIRQVNHLTQVEMSEALNINIKKYREIEKIGRIPDAEVLSNLYDKTGIVPSFLFSEKLNNLNVLNQTWIKFTPKVKKRLLRLLDVAVELFNKDE